MTREERREAVERWVPSEDEWYTATVIDRVVPKLLLILKLSNGDIVLCLTGKITNSLAGHLVCERFVPEGTVCSVRIKSRGDRKYFALECQFEDPTKIPTGDETVKVIQWCEGKTFGTGLRECGCPIFVTTSHQTGNFEEHSVGSQLKCRISPSNRKVGLAAAYVLNAEQSGRL